ncbi:MAG: ribonuclease P protein component [Minisyncoccia bacterium]
MLPKKNRLSKKEILELLPKAKTVRGNFLFLKFKYVDAGKPFKAGVSISKKVAKKAVERNKVRRIIYRVLSQRIKNIESSHIFFIINKISKKEELIREVEQLLIETKLYKQKF